MKKVLLLLSLILILSSCYTSEIYCGGMTNEQAKVQVQTKSNPTLIYGLVPLSKGVDAKKIVGDNAKYMVKTELTLTDGLISWITMGIYTPNTIKVYVPFEVNK